MKTRKALPLKSAPAPRTASKRSKEAEVRKHIVLPATDAQISRWYQEMIAAGQTPDVIDFGPSFNAEGQITRPSQEQISVGGRQYDDNIDRERWFWMRDHQPSVMDWLKRSGHFEELVPMQAMLAPGIEPDRRDRTFAAYLVKRH
jgi:hypothetical protein